MIRTKLVLFTDPLVSSASLVMHGSGQEGRSQEERKKERTKANTVDSDRAIGETSIARN